MDGAATSVPTAGRSAAGGGRGSAGAGNMLPQKLLVVHAQVPAGQPAAVVVIGGARQAVATPDGQNDQQRNSASAVVSLLYSPVSRLPVAAS